MGTGMGIAPGLAAAGTGMTDWLGTPQQQVENTRRALEFGQNLDLRKQQLAESTRQHDLMYAPVDMTPEVNLVLEQRGLPTKPAGSFMVPRYRAGNLLGAIAQATAPKEPPITLGQYRDTLTGLGLGDVLPPMPAQENIAPVAPEDMGQGTMTIPRPENVAALKQTIPRQIIPSLDTTLAARMKANREAAATKELNTQLGQARTEWGTAGDDEDAQQQVLAKYPQFNYTDLAGQKPTKEPKASDLQEYRDALEAVDAGTATATDKATIKAFERMHPDNSESKDLDLQIKKLRRDKMKMDGEMDTLDEAMASKTLSPQRATLYAQRYMTMAASFQKAAEEGGDDREVNLQLAKDARSRAARLGKYAGTGQVQTSEVGKKGETAEEVAARLAKKLKER